TDAVGGGSSWLSAARFLRCGRRPLHSLFEDRMAFTNDDQRFVPILQREHGDGAFDVHRRHLPLWVKPANPDILPGLQTCEVIRNTHASSEFESSLLLCQSGTGGGTAANIKCYRQCIFNPGADAILP